MYSTDNNSLRPLACSVLTLIPRALKYRSIDPVFEVLMVAIYIKQQIEGGIHMKG